MKLVKISTIVLLFLVITSSPVFAYKDISALALDTSITVKDRNFTTPDKMIIIPIENSQNLNSEEVIKGIFYYTISKLGFSDNPFHYIFTEEGNSYQSNKSGVEKKVSIVNKGDNYIFVGYIYKKGSSTFSERTLDKFKDFILDLSNKNSINPSKIEVGAVNFIKNTSSKLITIEPDNLFGDWNKTLDDIKNYVGSKYSPVEKSYSVEVSGISYSNANPVAGDEIEISGKLKNTSLNGLYGSSNTDVIATKVGGGNSSFYLNNEWLSQTQFSVLSEDAIVLPGEDYDFKFKVKAPLYIGERAETFQLSTNDNKAIGNGSFELKLNITKGDKRIIEINQSEAGFLRVRSEPSTVATEIAKVASGDRFFLLETNDNGFIRIDLGAGKSGWVAGWLTTEI